MLPPPVDRPHSAVSAESTGDAAPPAAVPSAVSQTAPVSVADGSADSGVRRREVPPPRHRRPTKRVIHEPCVAAAGAGAGAYEPAAAAAAASAAAAAAAAAVAAATAARRRCACNAALGSQAGRPCSTRYTAEVAVICGSQKVGGTGRRAGAEVNSTVATVAGAAAARAAARRRATAIPAGVPPAAAEPAPSHFCTASARTRPSRSSNPPSRCVTSHPSAPANARTAHAKCSLP